MNQGFVPHCPSTHQPRAAGTTNCNPIELMREDHIMPTESGDRPGSAKVEGELGIVEEQIQPGPIGRAVEKHESLRRIH